MTNLVNTDRLRITIMRAPESFKLPRWSIGSYWSADHGKARREWNGYVILAGIWASLKYRPDGR